MNNIKLLVVDDEIDFAQFVAEVAEGMNFHVLSTDNSSDFSLLYTIDINIIVLDLFMPEIDGIELLRFLYENKSEASIIFMSGKDQSVLHSAENIALEQGMEVLGTLQKPFRAKDLELLLAKYVRQTKRQNYATREKPSLEELQSALDNHELSLVYQPQINLASRKVIGFEALIRWHHPTKGNIPAQYFIPLAEKSNIIHDITFFTIKVAIDQLSQWQKTGYDLRMSINFSAKVLEDLDMPEKLLTITKAKGVDISQVMLEVTETALMSNITHFMDILARLKMKGFSLSIDDFGVGYSSLQQLVRAPFNELKIDQVFIRKMDRDKDCRTIVEISILLAHKLGMHVVAEGIENEKTWNILSGLGCEEGQGYWIGKAMPAEDVGSWMERWSSLARS